MKRIALLIIISTLFFFRTLGQGNSGMIYGKDHSYFLTAPDHWVLDNSSGLSQGIHAVFYPQGQSWKDAITVMYTTYASLDSLKSETIDDIIKYDIDRFRQNSPDLEIEEQKSLIISQNKTARLFSFPGDANGNFETVAYIGEKKGVIMIVITSRNKKDYKKNLKAFEELVRSYKFLSNQVIIR